MKNLFIKWCDLTGNLSCCQYGSLEPRWYRECCYECKDDMIKKCHLRFNSISIPYGYVVLWKPKTK